MHVLHGSKHSQIVPVFHTRARQTHKAQEGVRGCPVERGVRVFNGHTIQTCTNALNICRALFDARGPSKFGWHNFNAPTQTKRHFTQPNEQKSEFFVAFYVVKV